MHISGISLEALKGQQRLHRQNNLTVFSLLGWMSNLDGKHITDLVLTSPTVQLKMTPHDQEISLSFSGEGVSGNRSVTVLRSTATEMALYFLKNEGLPSE